MPPARQRCNNVISSRCFEITLRKESDTIDQYPFVHTLQTRWMDNDVYGHVNNVVYYAFFDTAVGAFLMSRAGLDYRDAPAIGLVIETSCTYFESIAFPDTVHIGVRISKLGSSSVRYEIGVFKNDHTQACAQGYFVHVYVDRATNRPTPIPVTVREAMQTLLVTKG